MSHSEQPATTATAPGETGGGDGVPPFKTTDGHEVAGIVEQTGYVPRWLIVAIIVAMILAAFCWIPIYGY